MADFSDYNLDTLRTTPQSLYELAGGLLPEMAQATGFDLAAIPDQANLWAFQKHIGEQKHLQDNIARVQELIGSDQNATAIAADWVDRSNATAPVERAFSSTLALPEHINTLTWSGGVGNWILRRTAVTEQIDPDRIDRVVLAVGNEEMRETEHQLVRTFAKVEGRLPTQAEFVSRYVLGRLAAAGFRPELISVESKVGDDILRELFSAHPSILDGKILVASNAPNTVQAAGNLRLIAREAKATFDSNGDQLFMKSDTIPVARKGEGTATHQNPYSALGQIARNAAFLHKNF